jgi:hypothetical protein
LRESIVRVNATLALSLVKHGATLDCRGPDTSDDSKNIDCLTLASSRGLVHVVEAILDRADGAEILPHNASDMALLAAVSEYHIDVVRLLLKRGRCNINARDEDGSTALMAAAARGLEDVVQLLVEEPGVDLNAQNMDGHTALMFAYHVKGQLDALTGKWTAALGGTVTSEAKELFDVALAAHMRVIDLLISKGADQNIKVGLNNIALLSLIGCNFRSQHILRTIPVNSLWTLQQ